MLDGPELNATLARSTGPLAVLSHTLTTIPAPHTLIRMPADAAAYAARLYAALREADAAAPTQILIERPPAFGPIWDAISDRLARATANPADC